MLEYSFEGGRLIVRRDRAEKDELIRRLRRLEGQVRGLQVMVEEDRYCLEFVQQVNAAAAALREVSMMEIRDHLEACVAFAVEASDGKEAIREMTSVLRAAMRQG